MLLKTSDLFRVYTCRPISLYTPPNLCVEELVRETCVLRRKNFTFLPTIN